ncbi:hypothetical protein EC968_000605 [Mortierella alpina]|nr:hypothetical protein EC968_000605 [Mortierella alpina]
MSSVPPASPSASDPITTPSPSPVTSAPPTTSYVPSPSADPNPSQPDPTPSPRTSSRRPGGRSTSSSGGPPAPTGTNPGDKGGGEDDSSSSSAPVGAIIGGIAGVLVLGFLIAVFVMRYKKKSRARKRRLDFLGDSADGASHRPVSTQGAGGPSPSPLPGSRPLEMAAMGGSAAVAASPVVGAAAAQHHANDAYDYQQGYQQAAYGGYPEQYSNDQYDPYYAQRQQQQPPQQQGYYVDPQQQQLQQQGYYQDNQFQTQFAPPLPISNNLSLGGGSPSMTHATASPPAYPHPPPSTATGDHHSPHTSFQSSVPAPVPGAGSSYDKNAMIENGYAGTQSSARNPQLVPEPQEGIKVPL